MENYQVPQNITNTQPVTQPITQAAPSGMPTASAVNIVIQNPSASPAPAPNYPCYPSNYYMQQPVYNMTPNNAYPQATSATPIQQNTNANAGAQPVMQEAAPVAAAKINGDEEETKESEKSDKKKKVVQLTDEYIQTLENYLRNPNKDVRIMGAKELSKRFEEDESRRNDRALNSLLNLTLQDPASDVRMMGLAIANGGLAQGDDTTVQILKNMQSSDAVYGQDALSATNALLKLSGNVVEIPDNSPDKSDNK